MLPARRMQGLFGRETRAAKSRGHPARLSDRNAERLAWALPCVLAAALLLPDLGDAHLWQDEAQTALIARTILEHGVPLGFDGVNHFSQELGKEYGEGYVWKWHTWLSFYVVAGSFALLGPGTAAARLPFALFGIASVALCFAAGRVLWRDRRAAAAGAVVLAVSVPFLILSRQCRYYSLSAFFMLLGIHAYARLRRDARGPTLELFAAATLLLHTHHVYAATLLAGLWLHALLLERAKLRALSIATGATLLANLPWIAWFSSVRPAGERYLDTVLDLEKAWRFTQDYAGLCFAHLFDPRLLALPAVLLVWSVLRREPLPRFSAATARNVALLASVAAATWVLLAVLSPLLFYRYLAPLAPVGALLSGLLFGALARRSLPLGVTALLLWVAATGSLRDHLAELTHDFEGPVEGIVRFLEARARPGDVVAISYGDLPLKFYTDLAVVGGLTGQEIPLESRPDWIILRRHTNTHEDRRVKQRLRRILAAGEYVAFRIDAPDTAFENRETPGQHRFRSPPRRTPRVVIHGRKR